MNSTLLTKISTILRLTALSILFGGSLATIIAAVTLIKAAEVHGIPVSQAAAANAPIFIIFSKVALIAGLGLILGESLNFAATGQPGKLKLLRYIVSFSCAALTMIFAFMIVPQMQQLQGSISTNQVSHEKFDQLHNNSRTVFGAIMLLAYLTLLLPVFEISSPKDPV